MSNTDTQQLAIGQSYFSKQQWEDAAHHFRAYLDDNPENPDGRRLLGETFLRMGFIEDAIRELEIAYNGNPKSSRQPYASALVAKANMLNDDGDSTSALDYCERALKISPSDGSSYRLKIKIWVRRGDSALLRDDLVAAAHAYRIAGDEKKAEQIEKLYRWQNQSVLEKQAQALELEEKWGQAAEVYHKLIALPPSSDFKLSWKNAYERCLKEAELEKIFRRGMAAIEQQDWEQAKVAFLSLVGLRIDYRKDGYWITELLDQVVKARSSNFVPRIPAYPHTQSAPVLIGINNARRLLQLARWGNGKPINLGFTPDGNKLIITSTIGVHIFNPRTMNTLRFIDVDTWVQCQSVSPGNDQLATGFEDGTIWIWRISDGALLRKLRGHTRRVNKIAYSHDGTLLASGGSDGFVRLWNVNMGRQIKIMEGHVESVRSLAFSPNDKVLAVVTRGNTVRLRHIPSGTLAAELPVADVEVRRAAFSADNKFLVTGQDGGEVKFWNLSDGSLQKSISTEMHTIQELLFSPKNDLLAVGGWNGDIQLWNTTDNKIRATLDEHTGLLNAMDFSESGEVLASSAQDNTIRLWDPENGTLLHTDYSFLGKISKIACSPDGTLLATAQDNSNVNLWSISKGEIDFTLQGHMNQITSLAFTDNGGFLATASQDGTIRIWRVTSKLLVRTIEVQNGTPVTLKFSPDDRLLLCGLSTGAVSAWDWENGESRADWPLHERAVSQLSFYDEQQFFTCSEDGEIALVDLNAGPGQVIEIEEAVKAIAVLWEQKRIVLGDQAGRINYHNFPDFALEKTVNAHQGAISALAVSPDDNIVAAASVRGGISLWVAGTDHRLATLPGHGGGVSSLEFSPDGALLISSGSDGTIRLWGVVGN